MNNGFYEFSRGTDSNTGLSIDTGSFATTGSNQFSGSQTITGSLNVTQGITGSLFGTASFALNAGGTTINTGSFVTTSSFNAFTSSYNTGSFTGSLSGTASFAVSSSRAVTSSFATSASWAPMRPGGSDTQIQYNSGSTLVGINSFTFNYQSQSLQQGLSTVASGSWSHAEGSSTQALGDYSHAEGQSTKAIGQGSHAEGKNTIAAEYWSHAEGSSTIASGSYSHAEGSSTIASGEYSHAEGNQTIALGDFQHVQGQFNQTSSAQSAFIIGNGTGVGAGRSNLVFASGSQFQVTGSVIATQGFTGSLFGTASFATTASNILGGTGNYISLWNTATSLSSSTIYQDGTGDLGIGTTSPLGILHLYKPAAPTRMLMDGDAGQSKIITFRTNRLQRFGLYCNSTAESGANAGSDFVFRAYNDAGTLLSTPLFIKRSSGNIGIGTTAPGAKLDVHGSAIITGSLVVTGSLIVTAGITGSLFGTSSWATNAVTASFITGSNVYGPFGADSILSASYALTASYALNAGGGGSGGTDLGLVQAMTVGLQNIF